MTKKAVEFLVHQDVAPGHLQEVLLRQVLLAIMGLNEYEDTEWSPFDQVLLVQVTDSPYGSEVTRVETEDD
eukprot:CAMPEP_0113566132 /NCGR_PEP_ID=MMETSP0015_2-20120614/22559_1 /TAXON_ID=2838 /ORGANISM="Odontella" /LENGTH=70 /DNA_ID=CAMNT_0000468399 /DNA_START=657 /DNA_END=866 /DNA_ORIENTATION=- /assembly_acc=CAM_ASM_000160